MKRRRHKAPKDVRLVGHQRARWRPNLKTAPTVRCHHCDGKVLHATRASASKHLHRLAARDTPDIGRLHVYRCRHQAGFHVGHDPRPDDPGQSKPTEGPATT